MSSHSIHSFQNLESYKKYISRNLYVRAHHYCSYDAFGLNTNAERVLTHLLSSECPAGPVREVGPDEQDEATTARAEQERLHATPRHSLRVQRHAAARHAEEHVEESRERHAE